MTRFAFDLADWFTNNSEQVASDLRRYFEGEGKGAFRGRWFEHFAAIGDPNRFEATDVLAVEALSVEVPTEAAATLLITEPERFNALLRQVPREQDLWQVRRLVVNVGDKADDLHTELRKLPGVDWVVAGKLLAAKRPRLVPILDSMVKEVLQPPADMFWLSMYDELADESRRAAIEEACREAPPYVSLLRRIDVALWMEGRRRTR